MEVTPSPEPNIPQPEEESLSLADNQEVSQLANEVIADYSQAVQTGDTERTQSITQKLESNSEMADLVAKQLEQKKLEQAKVEALKVEVSDSARRAYRLLEAIAGTRNQMHVVNEQTAAILATELRHGLTRVQASSDAEELASRMIALNNWVAEKMIPSVGRSMEIVNNYFNRRVPREIEQEYYVLKGLRNSIDDLQHKARVLRGQK